MPQSGPPPPSDPTGQYAAFSTGALTSNLDVVGVPMADFTLTDANPASGVNPALDVVLFGKIYDVAPDGTKTLVHRLVSPVRVADITKPIHINLPGTIHRYAAGHSIQFLLAITDATYVGSRATHLLTIAPDASHPSTVSMHVLQDATLAQNAVPALVTASLTNASLPNTAGAHWTAGWVIPAALLALASMLGALSLRREKTAR